ncbi:RING/FYVE/PHD zinc finger superfamily protein [Rhynchospora pubera]|uniref:RING/FYVE/PHD zinc finger superfamily protein n=1 Tax=Rhynchospora pubera TaxID=906938 RepID=A0AAV8FQI7_9POAL|nr:RING/FYVE/PHD zinc finger superfamily protein [Rhynchospora pubera]
MHGHAWDLYIQMQLVPHRLDASESVPILQPDNGDESENENEIINSAGDESRINIRIGNSSNGGESVSTVPREVSTEGMDREALEREIEERGSEESSVQDQPQCRICLDTGGDDMIAPCHCRGTQKYVHRSCLDHWRSTKEGFAFAHCTECRAVFVLRANVPPDRWWLRLKFQLLVVRDHTVIFFIVQLVVMMLAMLVYKFYGEELREMFEYEDHPYAFYAMSIMAVLLVGLLYGFFIAIICGQRIHERHYHVLAKQELTKEYIVEDREKSESIPELDSSHIMELRMLGLY